MSRSLAWIVPVVLAGTLVGACGGKSFENGGGDPDGGSAGSTQAGTDAGARDGGGSSSGGTSSGGSNHGGTTSGGKGGTGTGGATACDPADYEDAMGGSVPVLVINDTKKPIYLGQEMLGCASGPAFQVADSSGKALVAPGFCQTTCHMMLTQTAIACPAAACAIGGVTTLMPGESMSSQWSTRYAETVKLPPACQAKAGADACTRIADVKPGTYYFSAQAGSSLQCGTGPDAGASCGACTPTASGGCMTYGATIVPPMLQAKVEVQLDGSYGIGGPGGGGMVRSVEIVFKD